MLLKEVLIQLSLKGSGVGPQKMLNKILKSSELVEGNVGQNMIEEKEIALMLAILVWSICNQSTLNH